MPLADTWSHAPGGRQAGYPGVSHFAPLQRPARFNAALLAFLGALPG
jgi:pimeloyl-ACP methyl ester carboxylesterase